jgi:transcriptional regulator with XRE-family HTH domain
MRFPEVIRQARKAKGLSQATVAADLGVSQNAVSDWETGRCVPTVPLLSSLATLLDLDHGELLRLAAGGTMPIEALA